MGFVDARTPDAILLPQHAAKTSEVRSSGRTKLEGELRRLTYLVARLTAIEKQENKSMQPLKGILMAMLAGTVMLAQEPNTPAANKPLTGNPGVQADRSAAQTPPAQSK